MGPAATEIGRQRLADLRIAGIGHPGEQRLGGHHHAWDAIAALRRLLFDKGLLQGMGSIGRTQAFQGQQLATGKGRRRQQTGTHRLAIRQHRTGATLAQSAAEFRPLEPQFVAQGVQQRHAWIDVELSRLAIDLEFEDRHR